MSRSRPQPVRIHRDRDADLAALLAVRLIRSRVRVSPTVALVMAEAGGLIREGRNG